MAVAPTKVRADLLAKQAGKGSFDVAQGRYPWVDIFRGFAFLNMFVYHSLLFGKQYELIEATILNGLAWQIYQKLIAGSFFFLVGVSVYLGYATTKKINLQKYFQRWGQVAGCGLIVTLTSAVLYPGAIVTFGILQAISVCSLLSLMLVRCRLIRLAIPLGLLVVLAGVFFQDPVFNQRWLNWIGFSTEIYPTKDHQALFPWLGVVWVGLGCGPWIATQCARLVIPESPASRWLKVMGQHTLLLYMAHVPMILMALEAIRILS